MKIDEILPYERNARHNEKAILVVANSIREFGLRGTIGLESRENPVIVWGHTRVLACKSLGWSEIDDSKIEYCDDLTPEQIKAFRIADNKTGEVSTWNKSMLREEVRSLKSFDMSRFNVNFKSKLLPYGAERLKTDRAYNLDLVNIGDCAGACGYPTLEPCFYEPSRLLGFNYCKSTKEFSCGVHFFIDDYQFERLWTRPLDYVELLRKFECVLTPDFSLYLDMPRPMQAWNVYRARALGHLWQKHGLNVIPTLTWSDEASFEFAFDGLPRGGVVATSTVGIKRDKEAREAFSRGLGVALDVTRPQTLLLYGGSFEGLKTGDVTTIEIKANTAFRN